MKLPQALITAATISCFAYSTTAQIASWDIANVELDDGSYDSSFTLNATSKNTNLAIATLTLGSDANPTTSVDQYGFKVASADEQTTLAGAIANDHFIEFTFQAAPGYELNLSSINFFGQSTETGSDNVAFMSNIDGFVAGSEIAALSNISGTTGGFDTDSSGFGDDTIALSVAKYQNLPSITFRLYGWNSSSGSGLTNLRNLSGNDIALNGLVSIVPEPGTFALLAGFSALSFVMLRRRSA